MSTELSRKLRREATAPERAMWHILREFRQRGFHFRRQVQIGSYYADFALHRPAMVIEVDGYSHGTDIAQSNDALRDDYLRGRGYRVLRFGNEDVLRNHDGVFLAIEAVLAESSPHTAPPTLASLGRVAPSSATLPASGGGLSAHAAVPMRNRVGGGGEPQP
jgi:very-short-patch-repair endonuclease